MKWNPPEVDACPSRPAPVTLDSSSDGFGTSDPDSSGAPSLGSVCVAAKAKANSTNRESVQIEMVEIESLRFEIKRKTRLTRDALEFTLAKENTAD